MSFKSLIFDCDGVLVDSEVIYNKIERKYLSQLGLHYADSEYQERFNGLTSKEYIQKLSYDYRKKFEREFPTNFESVVYEECAEVFETDLQAVSGAKDLLEQLDLPIAVASSSNLRDLRRKLKLTGLDGYFGNHVYSGEQVSQGKPSPDLFVHTAKQLRMKPEVCLVIEDTVNGVKAGIRADMEVWGFTGGGHVTGETGDRLAAAGAKKVFRNYSSIIDHLF